VSAYLAVPHSSSTGRDCVKGPSIVTNVGNCRARPTTFNAIKGAIAGKLLLEQMLSRMSR